MTSHFICAGFEDVVSEINFDEKIGLVNINLNMPDSKEDIFLSLNLMQASVLAQFVQNTLAQADVKAVNRANIFGDLIVKIRKGEMLNG
ncbi:hypothetical protein [Megamonas hypermegale]|uniref:hypothetical protein n=1 Tax=Megamonas hypermegale TaxID=158847 RepID=UPI00195F2015|nr:hypothetical protein [Megamonas hypermegale]MBM6833911.1 hypothetical protein [Megamonas hypermegale]